jgi:Protein of unknown function (DUF3261)
VTRQAPRRSSWALVAALVAASAGAACGPRERTMILTASSSSDYPCVLHDPATLGRDFLVRQSLAIHAQRDGQPVDGQFDAIVQKRGDTLLIVGFGPMNVKAFTVEQRGDRITFHQLMGPELPFSPRNIIVDVHRVFFKHLPTPAEHGYSGVVRGDLDGETVEETWRAGELRASVFTRPGSALHGAIRVELGPGCVPGTCEPESATLHNEWFGYTLTISNDGYEQL